MERKPPSISTRRGDAGTTAAPGGARVSKGELRVEASGAVDELNAAIGVARAHCEHADLATRLLAIQRELFPIGSSISRKADGRRPAPDIGDDMVERLDVFVRDLEAEADIVRDWTIPGATRSSSFFEVARTVCRRAERSTVRMRVAGEAVQPNTLAYLNRLSDVLWLCARCIEARCGADARLRDERFPGPPWSQAW